jgi:hypothetical protein
LHFLFKFVFVILPPAALVWVNKWVFSLFSYTALTHPDWQERADLTGAALGTIAIVAVYSAYQKENKTRLAEKTKTFLIVAILLALACYGFRTWLHFTSTQSTVQAVIDVWEFCYVLMLLAVVVTIVDLRSQTK